MLANFSKVTKQKHFRLVLWHSCTLKYGSMECVCTCVGDIVYVLVYSVCECWYMVWVSVRVGMLMCVCLLVSDCVCAFVDIWVYVCVMCVGGVSMCNMCVFLWCVCNMVHVMVYLCGVFVYDIWVCLCWYVLCTMRCDGMCLHINVCVCV